MYYLIVAVWAVACLIRCVLKPAERVKIKELLD